MDNRIFNWSLNIIINSSAFLCAMKSKNKVLHILLECIYSVVILALPVLFFSFLIVAISSNEEVDICKVTQYIGTFAGGCFIYFVLSNRKNEKKIEDYMLLGALYVDEYFKHKKRIRRQKFILLFELLNFMLLYGFLLWAIISLIITLHVVSHNTFLLGGMTSLFVAYAMFVYGKRDEEIRKARKAMLGAIITAIWFIIVCVRINHYWTDITQLGFEDMLILFFSAIFTIPTIYEWIKNIPIKLIEPYVETVYRRKMEIIDSYVAIKKEGKKCGIQFINDLKEMGNTVVYLWKNGEKKRIIKTCIWMVAIIILLILFILIANALSVLMKGLGMVIEQWYTSLNFGNQKIINKLISIIFMAGIMLYALFKSPGIFRAKDNGMEKAKYIVTLLVFEFLFGVGIYAILI